MEAILKAVMSETMYQMQNGLQALTERMHESAARAAAPTDDHARTKKRMSAYKVHRPPSSL